MDTIEVVIIGAFVALLLGSLLYTVLRLLNAPRTGLDERSARLARLTGQPKLFDPLLAKPLTGREKLGWLIFLLIAIGAVVFTYATGIGVRG